MSDPLELESGEEVDTGLSTNDDEQGLSDPVVVDVNPESEGDIATVAEGDASSHPHQVCEGRPSGMAGSIEPAEERGGEGATIDNRSMQPLSSEGGEGGQTVTRASIEQPAAPIIEQLLRYANPHGAFVTGIDVNSEEAALKRSQRAARFGLSKEEEEGGSGREEGGETVEKREARAKRFGTKLVAYQGEPIKLMDKLPQIPGGDLRADVLHIHGTDEMSTADVFSYFTAYPPRNIEWINDSSCNAVWEDAESASRALRGLTNQPVALRSKFIEEDLESAHQPMEIASPAPSSDDVPTPTAAGEQPEVKVQWRLGVGHPKAKQLLLRYAVEGDQKVSGAAQRSNYYRKYGNPNKRVGAGGRRKKRSDENLSGLNSITTGGGGTWREKPTATDLRRRIGQKDGDEEGDISSSNVSATTGGRTWREKPTATDLRQRLGKRDREREGEEDEAMEVGESDPLAGLVKRPKPLHSERVVEEVEVGRYVEESEKQRMGSEVREVTGADLRKKIQKKRKKRDLQLRVGEDPRIVERTF